MTSRHRNILAGMIGLTLCAGPVVADAAGTEIFKRELPDGTVIFSDQPHPDATRVEPRDPQVIQSFQSPPSPPEREQPPEPFSYDRLVITMPGDDEVIWNHEETIDVSVDIEPELQEGHRLVILIDGVVVADASRGGRFTISSVFRGTHSLEAIIEDAEGTALNSAGPVTFHLRQHSILSPTRPQP